MRLCNKRFKLSRVNINTEYRKKRLFLFVSICFSESNYYYYRHRVLNIWTNYYYTILKIKSCFFHYGLFFSLHKFIAHLWVIAKNQYLFLEVCNDSDNDRVMVFTFIALRSLLSITEFRVLDHQIGKNMYFWLKFLRTKSCFLYYGYGRFCRLYKSIVHFWRLPKTSSYF